MQKKKARLTARQRRKWAVCFDVTTATEVTPKLPCICYCCSRQVSFLQVPFFRVFLRVVETKAGWRIANQIPTHKLSPVGDPRIHTHPPRPIPPTRESAAGGEAVVHWLPEIEVLSLRGKGLQRMES